MTLSDRRVRQALNRRFVCVRVDLDGHRIAGESFAHAPGDPPGSCIRGNGEHNVQILLLTPELRLLDVVSGYVGPRDLLPELELAWDLWKRIRGVDLETAARIVALRQSVRARLNVADTNGPFAPFIDGRVRADRRFVARHPLLPLGQFRAEDLVGSARTFFGSATGRRPRERIGTGPDSRPSAPRQRHRSTQR